MKKTPPAGVVNSVIFGKKITEFRLIEFLMRLRRYKIAIRLF